MKNHASKSRILFVPLRLLRPLVAFASATAEDAPFETGLELIRNELLCAKTGLRALAVAAHPDDEDGGTLSFLRRTLGVETHLCLSTRGEGGQNESGPELGADLAVVRTHEIEAASKILGAKAWYLNLPDFGYSKSPEETLKIWGHDEALKRLVRIIRLVRPNIIFTNHDPEGHDHGHHVATGRLVVEAFDAAADPKMFPEQMKEDGTQAWAVQKLYIRHSHAAGRDAHFRCLAARGRDGPARCGRLRRWRWSSIRARDDEDAARPASQRDEVFHAVANSFKRE